MKDVLKVVVFGGIFAIPFLTLYVENDYFFPFITGKNFWFRIIVDVMFAAWVLLMLYDAKYRPKWSWILGGFSVLLVVMFFANLFGVHPRTSFFSNFERMDGYVSLVHTFMYFVVLGSVMLTKELWKRLFMTSLGVASLVAFIGICQYFGVERIPQLFNASTGEFARIDSTLGNAAYMAIYMLFHIFISVWLLVDTKSLPRKLLYGVIIAALTFVLIETGTRGTALGLASGVFVMSAYIGLFGAKFKEFRKYAIGAFVLLIIVAAGFIAGRDSEFIQNNPNFARIANISFNDLTIRTIIWGTAIEGAKERPILGYGQSNFNYVFNEHYKPTLYAQEQWFDRSHNIFMDWLVTGGILGLLAYLSIFGACVWYLLIRPLVNKKDESFTVLERGILLGILAGYFTHNLVVFDNIVSYIFFAIILGLIHMRIGVTIPKLQSMKVDTPMITQFAAPITAVALVVVIYFAHAPGMLAAADIIKAFRTPDPAARLEAFRTALERDSFAQQEIVEQLAQQSISLLRSEAVSAEVKNQFASFTEQELNNLIADKPGDARVHVFAGSYYRSIGQLDKAAAEMQRAHELSPLKQSIMLQQGFVELARNDFAKAVEYMQPAFDLDTRNLEAREYLAGALIYAGRSEEAIALMDSDAARARFGRSDFIIGAANQAKLTDFLIEIYQERINTNPTIGQNWASLAFLHYQASNTPLAIETLKAGAESAPDFATLSACVIDNLENNREPAEGC